METAQLNTTIKSVPTTAQTGGFYAKLLTLAKENYFSVIAMTISIGSILGGIAAMFIFQNGAPIWQLAVCMLGAMANNVAAIGQAPVKPLVNIFLLSTILNIGLILLNVLA